MECYVLRIGGGQLDKPALGKFHDCRHVTHVGVHCGCRALICFLDGRARSLGEKRGLTSQVDVTKENLQPHR